MRTVLCHNRINSAAKRTDFFSVNCSNLIDLPSVWRSSQQYCAYTTASIMMVGRNQPVPDWKRTTITGLPTELSTYGRRENHHELDLNSQRPIWWDASGSLHCTIWLTEWATRWLRLNLPRTLILLVSMQFYVIHIWVFAQPVVSWCLCGSAWQLS